MTNFIVWYDRYEHEHKPFVGGKNASLGEMMRAEMPVPPGFALTTDAYGMIWRDKELVDRVNELLQGPRSRRLRPQPRRLVPDPSPDRE